MRLHRPYFFTNSLMPEPTKPGIAIRLVQEWDLLASQRVTVFDLLPFVLWDEDAPPVPPEPPADAD